MKITVPPFSMVRQSSCIPIFLPLFFEQDGRRWERNVTVSLRSLVYFGDHLSKKEFFPIEKLTPLQAVLPKYKEAKL